MPTGRVIKQKILDVVARALNRKAERGPTWVDRDVRVADVAWH